MAEELLVDAQIDNGEMIIDRLLEDGLDVTVAFWVRNDEGLWRLYVASPEFDDRKPGKNYLAVRDSLAKVPDPEVRFWPINLINNQNTMARDALMIAGRLGKQEGVRYRGPRLGDLPIEEAYIYPRPAIPLRQSFAISYVRQGETNEWLATTRRRELHRSVRHKGAVSYSTGQWPGDTQGHEKFALIHVLVEVDPSLDERAITLNPVIRDELLEQARSLADKMFEEKHTDARIHHHDLVECDV